MVRFLHTADLQLGMTRHFLDADAQARYTDARIDAIRKIAALARAEQAAFVVVAGDVFESSFVSPQTVLRSLDAFARIPVPVFLLPGNHDPLDAASIYRSRAFTAHRPAHVHVLWDARPVEVSPGVEVVGAPWTSKHPVSDLVSSACRDLAAFEGVRVMVGHGIVDTLNPDRASLCAISVAQAEAALAERRIHFLALGDRHSATSVGATGRIWYAGTPEVTDFDEVRPGRVLCVDLDGDRAAVAEHALGAWRFALLDAEVSSQDDLEALDARIGGMPDKPTTVLKLSLHGSLTFRQNLVLEALLEHHRTVFGGITTWERHTDLVMRPDDVAVDDLQLSGFARQALAELSARLGTDARAAQALALLHRLSAGAGA